MQDRRIFNVLIEHAWSEISEDKPHKIAINRLRGPRHRGAERVVDSVKTLMKTLVEVPTWNESGPSMFTTQLLGETTRTIDEDSPNALLIYEFPKGLRKIINDSRYWGRIKAHVMFAFSSKYALTLYEAVCLRANLRTNEQTFTVETFRAMLGVEPDKLHLFKNLKKWAIDPALTEVNGLSDFTVEIEPMRDGGMLRGPLTGFRLRWERKDSDAWQRTLKELLRPSVGRRARIEGKVDRMVS